MNQHKKWERRSDPDIPGVVHIVPIGRYGEVQAPHRLTQQCICSVKTYESTLGVTIVEHREMHPK